MSTKPSKRKAQNKGMPSPLSVFVLAVMAFIFGAPLGLVLFLAGIGIIVWRVQKAANKMAKLPPLPSREDELGASNAPFPSSYESDTASHGGLSDSTWGRSDAPAPVSTPSPRPIEQNPEPLWQPAPAPKPARLETPPVAPSPSSMHAPTITRPASAYRINARRQQAGLGINLATEAGLRHAVVAMTVLGPCRALSPYQEESSLAAEQLNARDQHNRPRGEA